MRLRIILILLVYIAPLQGQSILPSDSTRVHDLFRKAFASELYSANRQHYLDTILSIDHTYAWAWQQKAMPLFKQRKYSLAIPLVDSAVKYDKQNHWREYRAYMYCIFVKDYTKAIEEFNVCEARNKGGIVMDHTYSFYKGLCYLMLNKYAEAETLIKLSVVAGEQRVGEGHFLEYFYLGISQLEQQKISMAIASFDKAIKYYPNFSDALYYKAYCLEKLLQLEAAKRLYTLAFEARKKGYTINEDGAVYEQYPYQLRENELKAKLGSSH